MSETSSEKATAPFVPWNALKTFIQSELKAKVVPPKIDSSMFPSKSGTDARLLRNALRFNGLVKGENDETTEKLRELVAAFGTEAWKQAVTGLLLNYAAILDGVSIAEGTQKELEDAFRERGDVSGSTLKKAVRLYLAMATEAGIKLSPHFKQLRGKGEKPVPSQATTPPTNGGVKTNGAAKAKRRSKTTTPIDAGDPSVPPGVEVYQPLPNRQFKVWIPSDLPKADLDFAMLCLKGYLKLRRPNDE